MTLSVLPSPGPEPALPPDQGLGAINYPLPAYTKMSCLLHPKRPLCISFRPLSSFPSLKSFCVHHFHIVSFHPSALLQISIPPNPTQEVLPTRPASSHRTPLHSSQPRSSFKNEVVFFFGSWSPEPFSFPLICSDINLGHVLQPGVPQQSSFHLQQPFFGGSIPVFKLGFQGGANGKEPPANAGHKW